MTNLDKKLRKRWGKKFKDTRDWPVCNERLVKRGVYFLALDFVERWDEELEEMNRGKRGAPFQFPNTMIQLQGIWHAHRCPYRMIEGITQDLCSMGHLPAYDNYSTVNRRVNQLDLVLLPPKGGSVVVFSDGTGLQAVNGGEYLREKYGKKNRRWVQVIMLGDAEHNEPVSYEINLIPASESESTERQLAALLRRGVHVISAGGDGGLDNKNLWNFCENQNLVPVIKPDKNSRTDTGCVLRDRDVGLLQRQGYRTWAKRKGYGRRWPSTEGIFSAFKRMFGEQVVATSVKGMLQEAALKIWAYQRLKRYGEDMV